MKFWRMLCIVPLTVCLGFIGCSSIKTTTCVVPETVPTPVNPFPQTVTITGVVKNENGNPLNNASVQINNGQLVQTNESGIFSTNFTVESAGATTTLYAAYPELVTAVRSYHAHMGNVHYDIILRPPVVCCINTECFVSPINEIEYTASETRLNEIQTAQLLSLADSLKEHPLCSVQFTAYGKSRLLSHLANERLLHMRTFLADKGITEQRVVLVRKEGKQNNVVEVDIVRNGW